LLFNQKDIQLFWFLNSNDIWAVCNNVEEKRVTMNGRQKLVCWIGIVVIVLMCLFPPWVRVIEVEGSRIVSSPFYEFPRSSGDKWWRDKRCLLSPPEPIMNISEIDHNDLMVDKSFPFKYVGDDLLDSPGRRFSVDSVQVDLQRLGIQCVIVALITVGLLCTFTTKEEHKYTAPRMEIRKGKPRPR
jgi:hypothetical protein